MKNITIPAAGNTKEFKVSGLSLYVFQAPGYASLSDAPKLGFDGPGLDWPIESGDVIPYDECGFSAVSITGTAASAGDVITVQGLRVCEDAFKQPDRGAVKKYIAGQTRSLASTDAPQALDLATLQKDGELPETLYISARENDLAWGFVDGGATPDQSDSWHKLTAGQDPIEIRGIDFIDKFQFASLTAGAIGTLVYSPEY